MVLRLFGRISRYHDRYPTARQLPEGHMPHSGQRQQSLFTTLSAAAAGCLLLAPGVAGAQAFAESGKALVDYTRADLAPSQACADLQAFKGRDILALQAT